MKKRFKSAGVKNETLKKFILIALLFLLVIFGIEFFIGYEFIIDSEIIIKAIARFLN